MYVALNSVTIQGRAGWPEMAHLAHRLGYGGVDPDLAKAMNEGIDSTRALFAELKLKPSALPLPIDVNDPAKFEAGLKALPEAAAFARAIGCPRMFTWVMSSSRTPKAELRKTLKERFSAAAAILAKEDVRMGLEFLGPLHIRRSQPYEFIYRMDEMVEFTREIGPNAGVLLDSWHWHHAGATPGDIVSAGKSRIVHVHLSDAPDLPPEQIRDSERLIPGEGIIDWKGFFGALVKIGYTGACSPEIFGAGLKDMTAEDAARAALEGSLKVMRASGVKV